VFLRAQRRLTLRWLRLTDDELLQRLKLLLEKKGRLSETVINDTLGVPSIDVFSTRFGSLRNAYRLIGYQQKWNADWIDRKDEFASIISNTAAKLVSRLKKVGSAAHFETGVDVLTVNGVAISLRLARSWSRQNRQPIWTIYRRIVLPKGLILAIRLNEPNREVLDYILIPTRQMKKEKLCFMKAGLHRFEAYHHASFAAVARAIEGVARLPPAKFRQPR